MEDLVEEKGAFRPWTLKVPRGTTFKKGAIKVTKENPKVGDVFGIMDGWNLYMFVIDKEWDGEEDRGGKITVSDIKGTWVPKEELRILLPSDIATNDTSHKASALGLTDERLTQIIFPQATRNSIISPNAGKNVVKKNNNDFTITNKNSEDALKNLENAEANTAAAKERRNGKDPTIQQERWAETLRLAEIHGASPPRLGYLNQTTRPGIKPHLSLSSFPPSRHSYPISNLPTTIESVPPKRSIRTKNDEEDEEATPLSPEENRELNKRLKLKTTFSANSGAIEGAKSNASKKLTNQRIQALREAERVKAEAERVKAEKVKPEAERVKPEPEADLKKALISAFAEADKMSNLDGFVMLSKKMKGVTEISESAVNSLRPKELVKLPFFSDKRQICHDGKLIIENTQPDAKNKKSISKNNYGNLQSQLINIQKVTPTAKIYLQLTDKGHTKFLSLESIYDNLYKNSTGLKFAFSDNGPYSGLWIMGDMSIGIVDYINISDFIFFTLLEDAQKERDSVIESDKQKREHLKTLKKISEYDYNELKCFDPAIEPKYTKKIESETHTRPVYNAQYQSYAGKENYTLNVTYYYKTENSTGGKRYKKTHKKRKSKRKTHRRRR